MTNFKPFILTLFLFISCGVFFNGCLEAPVSPFGAVSGKIFDRLGFPERQILVSAGHYPYLITDNSGAFSFSYLVKPYDLVLGSQNIDEVWSEKYLNLTSDAPRLIDFKVLNNASSRTSLVVTFPKLDSNRFAFLKFISSEQFSQGNYTGEPFDTAVYSYVDMPGDKSEISGKLLYLEFEYDSYYNMIRSYRRFGIKDITLQGSFNNRFSFTGSEINNAPQTSHVNFSVVFPGAEQNLQENSYLYFAGMNHNSSLGLEVLSGALTGTFSMPVIYQLNCKLMISSIDYNNYGDVNRTFADPGGNAAINFDNPITLVRPINGQTHITDSSVFEVSDDGEKGVYCFSFYSQYGVSPQSETYLVTDRKKVTLGDVKSIYTTFVRGGGYYWQVVKYSHYNSIDDFAAVKYPDDINYTSTRTANYGVFTIAP